MTFSPRLAAAMTGACLFIATATASYSADVNLSWEAPTSNTDGSPASDIKGYRVHVGTAPGVYTRSEETGNRTTATIGSLSESQTYYFAVTAFDSAGTESDPSNEISHSIPAATTAPEPVPATPTPTPPPVVGGIAKGDVDGNGLIAMPDVLATLQMVVGSSVFSQEMKDRADVWPLAAGLPLGDGKVTLDDCLAILRKLVQPGVW